MRYLILKNYFLSHENNSGGIQQREDYDLRGFYDVLEKVQVFNDNMNLERTLFWNSGTDLVTDLMIIFSL